MNGIRSLTLKQKFELAAAALFLGAFFVSDNSILAGTLVICGVIFFVGAALLAPSSRMARVMFVTTRKLTFAEGYDLMLSDGDSEERYGLVETLQMSGDTILEIGFLRIAEVPIPPQVGTFYSDGEWISEVVTKVKWNSDAGWIAFDGIDRSLDISSDDQLKAFFKSMWEVWGWYYHPNSELEQEIAAELGLEAVIIAGFEELSPSKSLEYLNRRKKRTK